MSCCPPGSEPYLASNYAAKGEKKSITGVEFYSAGTPAEGKKAILIIPDIWGWDSGRTRAFADMLAEKGYYVAVPKLLMPPFEGGTDGDGLPPNFDLGTRGGEMAGWIKPINWPDDTQAKMTALIGFLKEQKITTFSMLGFCYGAYPIAKTIADKSMWKDIGMEIVCAVSPHPSIQIGWGIFGDDKSFLPHVDRPFLLMPAGGDPDDYRPGGEIFEELKKADKSGKTRTMATEFADMNHGWSVRGDITDAAVKAQVDKFIEHMTAWFTEHMPP